MKRWCLGASVRLWFLISLSGCLSITTLQPGWAEEKSNLKDVETRTQASTPTQQQRGSKIPQLSEIELPIQSATTLVQAPTPTNTPNAEQRSGDQVVPITSVKANPTDKGVEVILETTQGNTLQVTNSSTGNNFIADITGGQLRLSNGDAFTFKSEKPLAGITEITVVNIDATTVRVTVVGEKTLPMVELFDDDNDRRNGFNTAINIRNLFNIDYANSAAFGDKQSIERGEPFTIIGSVSWEL